MTNRMWVTLHILWKAVSSLDISSYTEQIVSELHIVWKAVSSFLQPTGCEWCCPCCEGESHHTLYYDWQEVNNIAHFVKGSLITSYLMTNRKWVTLHILWKAIPSHLFLWPTAGECISHLWIAVSIPLFLWQTGCEWHCAFCERQSHLIFSYYHQQVSTITYSASSSLITCLLWWIASEWHCTFYEGQSHHMFSCIWSTGSEWHMHKYERKSHYILSYDQQKVSDIAHVVKGSLLSYDQQEVGNIAHFVKGKLVTSFPVTNSLMTWLPMTNGLWVTLQILWNQYHEILLYEH